MYQTIESEVETDDVQLVYIQTLSVYLTAENGNISEKEPESVYDDSGRIVVCLRRQSYK